jgi:hypothetical protein
VTGQNFGTVTDAYWDTQTTGPVTNISVGMGLTTAQLQSLDLSTAFVNPGNWGIVASKSYPYLCWQVGNCSVTPQVVSGTVFTDQGTTSAGSGITVSALANGAALSSLLTGGAVTTGANGYYYYLLAPNTLAAGANVLTFAQNIVAATNGAALADQVSGTVGGLDILAGTLHEVTPTMTNSVLQTHLATAEGSDATAIALVNGLKNLQIDAAGAFAIDTAITYASGTVTLDTGGALTQPGGAITATGLAVTVAGTVTLNNAANAAANLAAAVTGAGKSFTYDSAVNLAITTVNGVSGVATNAGDITVQALGSKNITLDQAVNAGGSNNVSLTAGGSISQGAAAGVVTANQLTADATGDVSLASFANNVNKITGSAGGNFAFLDSGALTVPAAGISAGNGKEIALTTEAGGLTLSGALTAVSGTLNLVDLSVTGGTLTETAGGTIATAGLTAETVLDSGGAIALTQTGNAISGNITLVAQTTTAAPANAAITLFNSVGTALFDVSTLGAVVVQSGGAITEPAGATLAAGSLVARTLANGGAAITLDQSANTVGGDVTLTALNAAGTALAAGNLTYVGATGNAVTIGAVSGGGVGGFETGIGTTGTATVQSGGTLGEASGALVTASTLTGSSVGGTTLTGANQVTTLGAFANTGSGGFSFTDAQALSVTGPVASAGNLMLTTTTGALTLSGNLIAGGTATLTSAGMITQTGGIITAATLTGSSAGNASLTGNNAVGVLGPFTVSGGNFALTDANTNLAVTGAVTASGTLTLAAVSDPDLTISSTLSGTTVTLFANGTITEAAGGTITATNLVATTELDAGGAITLTQSGANTVGGTVTLSALNTAGTAVANGAVGFIDTGGFTIASQGGAQSGVATTGAATLVAGGNLTIAAGAALTGNAIVLSTPGAFINNAGAAAVTATGGGRWLIYSATPGGDNFGNLDSANTAIWGATLASLPPAGVTQTGNRYLFAQTQTLTVTTTNATKVYGQDATAAVAGSFALSGFAPGVAGAFLGDSATNVVTGTPAVTSTGAAATASVAGGPYTITATTGSLAVESGYSIAFADTGLLSVTPVVLTAMVTGNPTKTYDGTTTAALASGNITLSGFVLGQGASVSALTGTYATANAGSGIAVSTGLAASDFTANPGTSLSNYTLPTGAAGTGTITPALLTAAITGNPTKTYDGATTATLTPANYQLSGFVTGQSASVTQTAGSYATANAGGGITISASLGAGDFAANAGTLLSNYTLPTSAAGTGAITPALLTAAITGNPSKIYDGTTTAALASSNFTLSGFVAGQGASVTPLNGTYATANAGNGIAVSASLGAGDFAAGAGTLLSNYTLPTSAAGTGSITPVLLTAAITGNPTKIYDGNTTATLASSNFTLSGFVAGQSASVTQTAGSYATANAGGGIAVSASLGAGDFAANAGTLLSNYVLPTGAAGTGSITPVLLTAAITGNPTKTYDGTTTAALTPGNVTLSGFVAGQGASVSALTGTYASANVGSGIAVNAVLAAGNFTANPGTLLSNYVLPTSTAGTGVITPKALTITADDASKVYGNLLSFAGSEFTVSGLVASDTVTSVSLASPGAAATAGVGAYAITASSAQGSGLSNYTITYLPGMLTVTPRPITVSADDLSRLAGAPNPPLTFAVTSGKLVNGDMLTGALATLATGGSLPGLYPITQGTLAATSNYALSFVDGTLAVLPLPEFGVSPDKFITPVLGAAPIPSTLTQCTPGDIAAALAANGNVVLTGAGACGSL